MEEERPHGDMQESGMDMQDVPRMRAEAPASAQRFHVWNPCLLLKRVEGGEYDGNPYLRKAQ